MHVEINACACVSRSGAPATGDRDGRWAASGACRRPGNLGNIPVASCGAKVTDVDSTPLRRLTERGYPELRSPICWVTSRR